MRPILILAVALLAWALTAPAARPAGPALLVLADSIGNGLDASAPARGYTALVADGLGLTLRTGGSVRNLAGARARWDAYAGPPPALIVLQVGVNDAASYDPAAWPAAYAALLRDLRASGATVVAVTPPWSTDPATARRLAEMGEAVRAAARETGALVADGYGATAGREEWYPDDSVHPGDEGHAAIAQAVRDALAGRVWLPALMSVSVSV